MKTAAAMGVATVIAAGAHSMTGDGPVHAQASSDPQDDVLDVSDGPSGGTSHAQPAADTPSGLATDSARAPQQVQQAAEHSNGSFHAQGHAGASATETHAAAPAPGTPSTDTPSSQPPATQPPASTPTDPSDSSGDEQSGQDGSVVGGVVDGVGGVVGGVAGGLGNVVGGLLG